MQITKTKKTIIILGAVLMTATVQLSSAGLNNTMYSILNSMDGLQYYALLAVLSSLGMAIMTVVGGRLGDQFGRKNITLFGAILSLTCMIIMGVASNLWVFIISRGLLSFGIGFFLANPFAIIADICSREEFPKYSGLLQATLMAATFIGSTVAGYLVGAGMSSVAIIYPGVVALVGAIMVYISMPKFEKPDRKMKIDYAGMVLVAVFMLSLCLSLNFGGTMGFTDPIIIGGLALSIVSAIVLVKVENKASQPAVPIYLLKNTRFTGVCLLGAFIALYEVVMASYVPVTGQALMGLSAATTGYFTLPRTILAIVLPAFAAKWVVKNQVKNARKGLIIGGLIVTCSFVAMIFVGEGSPVFLPFILMGVTGIHEALKGVSQRPLAAMELEAKDMGVGIGMMSCFSTLVMTILLSLTSPVYTKISAADLSAALRFMYVCTALSAIIGVLIAVFALKEKNSDE